MKPKILIVDDDEQFSDLLQTQICKLVTSAADIEYSNNIQDAKIRIQANHYDIATIDMNLPVEEGAVAEDISGMALIPVLRASNCQSSIIVMTGETRLQRQDEIINWSIDKGASDVILKETSENYIVKVAASVAASFNQLNEKNYYANHLSGDTVIVFSQSNQLVEYFSDKLNQYRYQRVNSLNQAVDISDKAAVCACIVAVQNDTSNGFTFVKQFHSIRQDIPIIAIATDTRVTADYIKTARTLGAVSAVRDTYHAMEELKRALLHREKQLSRFNAIIGQHPCLLKSKGIAYVAAHKSAPVLILGASGTGKELLAKGISDLLGNGGPYVNINCAAIPKELLESELFGHEKGAFTGANSMKKGLFEQAIKGALFLDEIGELSLDLQAKILKVIENKSMKRIGGLNTIELQVKVIAATNADIKTMVKKGEFRNDLYQRLKAFTVVMPPLMERTSDIPFLVHYFIDQICKREQQCLLGIDKKAMGMLQNQDWSQGNVRELKNVLERIMAFIPESQVIITREDVEEALVERSATTNINNVITLELPRAFTIKTIERWSTFICCISHLNLILQQFASYTIGEQERNKLKQLLKINSNATFYRCIDNGLEIAVQMCAQEKGEIECIDIIKKIPFQCCTGVEKFLSDRLQQQHKTAIEVTIS